MSVLPDPGATRAVLIGTSHYDHLESLPAVSNNLTALAEALTGPTSWALPQEHCTIISNPTTADMTMAAVRAAAEQARDTVLIYFAGHGLVDPEGDLYLAMPQSKQQRVETGLPYRWIRQALLNGRADRCVVVLDCCYSGLALGTMGGPSDLADQAAVEGTFLLAAAAETRQALAPPDETFTAFTNELLDTLQTGIPNGPELIDFGALYRHLRIRLAAKGRPDPQARDRNTGARLALGRNLACLPTTATTPSTDGEPATGRSWPSPSGIHTLRGFFKSLADVRVTSGLTHQMVSQRSGGRISPGTVSRLLNRESLPKTWHTTAAYLSACGVPDPQVAEWHAVWMRLLADTTTAAAPLTVPQPRQNQKPTVLQRLTGRVSRRNGRSRDHRSGSS
ncbi:caspase family protein [Streptomyces sp. NTK 937]|uniref:caspase, EACC1-associated type n=1 Tax=Streptomyces sp. NTK 937 TaxID=1487711 RepID=UPI0004A93F1A|nr:caspase family protein [Streptomyces sp. NTK 937]KDQ69271.1 peptidase C14 [Streptomyces sp. NTK 937]